MVVVWMLMILIWRMLSKMLRRFGRWALIMPVGGVGAGLFGVNVWGGGTVLVGWRQAGRSGALPVAMLGAGICGLWTAASLVRSWGAVGFSMLNAFTVQAMVRGPRQQVTVISPGAAGMRAAWPAVAKPGGPAIAMQGKFGSFTWSRVSWRVATGRTVRVVRPHVVILGHSLWWGRLLILGAVLVEAEG